MQPKSSYHFSSYKLYKSQCSQCLGYKPKNNENCPALLKIEPFAVTGIL